MERVSVAEPTLNQAEYERFRDLIRERSGLNFPEDKRQALARGLAEAMRSSSFNKGFSEYYALLASTASNHRDWDQLVSALTIGETYFFRNNGHFDALAKQILPEVIAQRDTLNRRIRIWSAGCATGEEPYSVAMALYDLIPNLNAWNILILATDINRAALAKAREGVYGTWSFRGVDKRQQERFFGFDGHSYALRDEIKRMVTFDYLNLIEDPYPSLTNNTHGMDIILCRNVTIYFSGEVTQRVVSRFRQSLVDGGWLIPGPSEPNMVTYGEFEQRDFPGAVIYRRPITAKAAPRSGLFATPGHAPTWSTVFPPPAGPATSSTSASALPAWMPAPKPAGAAFPSLAAKPAGAVAAPHPVAATRPSASQAASTSADPYKAALALLEAGRNDEALAKLMEKMDAAPTFAPAYIAVAKIHANKGNLEQAQVWCERAIERDKLLPGAYYILSMIYQEQALWDKALEALKKTVYLNRDFTLAHYNLGHLYRRQNMESLARRSFQNVQRLLHDQPPDAVVAEGDGLVAGRLLELVDMELAKGA